MDDFKSNVPNISSFARRSPRVIINTPIDTPTHTTLESKTNKGEAPQPDMVRNLLNPSGDGVDNPYDFGANLGDM